MLEPEAADPFILPPRRWAMACGVLAAATGAVVLAAWFAGAEAVTSLAPGWPSMTANAALGFLLLGAGLVAAARGRTGVARACAALAALLAAATLAQDVTGRSLGIDHLLVRDGSALGSAAPGRMSVLTSASFLLLAVPLAWWRKPSAATRLPLLVAAGLGLFDLAFFLLGTLPPAAGTRMAAPTALGVLVLAAGAALGQERPLAELFLGRARAASAARRLLLPAAGLSLLFGWLAHRAAQDGTLTREGQAALALFASLATTALLVGIVLLRLLREEQRRAEADRAMREARERLHAIFRATPSGLVLTRPDGTVADLNPMAEVLWGLPRERFLDPSFRIEQVYADPSERARVVEALRRDGSLRGLEVRMRRGDGQVRAMLFNADLVELGGERLIVGAGQDITELRQAQERFASVFDASPVAIAFTRDDGRVVDANPAFLALTGYPREELLAPGFRAGTLYEHAQDRQRLLSAMRARGAVRGLQLRLRRRDGALRTVLAALEAVDLGGAPAILGLFQDVTERQRLQEEREARIATEAELERLRRTDEFRVGFINSTAHELSTPLTPLMLSAASLRRDLGDPDAAERHLGVIQRAVDRLARVVGDMVSAADLQARAIALDRKPLGLAQQLRAAVEAHRAAAAAAGLTLTLEGPSDPELTVDADVRRLRTVLGHLLGNAIKFTPPGGRVRVVARREGGKARVEVRDTGAGLTAQQLEGLWRPYAQAHDKTQRTDSGSGLGLYVTKGIVELHKGEVGVSSPGAGQGSTFWFTLPLAGASHEEPEEAEAAEPEADPEEAIEVLEDE